MTRPTLKTKLCDMLNIEYPILSAGMGPNLLGEDTGSNVDLVVAVSEAGGLGVLGTSGYNVEELRQVIREVKSRTSKPFGVDLLLPKNVADIGDVGNEPEVTLDEFVRSFPKPYYEWIQKVKKELDLPDVEMMVRTDLTPVRPLQAVQACLEENVPLFCAGLGDPGFMVEEAHVRGIKVLGLAGNTRTARSLVKSGVDLLVAQGHEAGGHTGKIGTMALLPSVLDVAGNVPVLAAGGIGDGRGIAAALAMGCSGVWIGTRFLATKESGARDMIKENILQAGEEDTVVSPMHTGKPCRALSSRFHLVWNESGLTALPFPLQVLVASCLLSCFIKANKADYVGGFAGQISGLIREIKPAGQVLREMVAETVDILTHKMPQRVIMQ